MTQLTRKILNAFNSEYSLTQLTHEIVDNKINLNHLEEESYHPLLRDIVLKLTSCDLPKECITSFLKAWITNINEQLATGIGIHVGNQLLIILEPLADDLKTLNQNLSKSNSFNNKKRKAPQNDKNTKRVKSTLNALSTEETQQINETNLSEEKKNLIKYFIKLDFYSMNTENLQSLGYTDIQTDKLLLCKNYKKNIEALLREHDQLIEILSHEQIITLLKGNHTVIKIFLNCYKQLLQNGFTLEQIVKIGGREGGTVSLGLAIQYASDLIASGFSTANIVSIMRAGNSVFSFIGMHHRELIAKNNTPKQLVQISFYSDALNKFNNIITDSNRLDNVGKKIFTTDVLEDVWYFLKENNQTFLYYFFPSSISINTLKYKVTQIYQLKKNYNLQGIVRGYSYLKAIKIEESLFNQIFPSIMLSKIALSKEDFKDISPESERYFQITTTSHAFLKCDSVPQLKINANRLTVLAQKARMLAQETGEKIESYLLGINNEGIFISNYGAYIDILKGECPEKYKRVPADLNDLPYLIDPQEIDFFQPQELEIGTENFFDVDGELLDEVYDNSYSSYPTFFTNHQPSYEEILYDDTQSKVIKSK